MPDTGASSWQHLIEHCIAHRIEPHRFRHYVKQLRSANPTSPSVLSSLVLQHGTTIDKGKVSSSGLSCDMLLPLYLDQLLAPSYIQCHHVLEALLEQHHILNSFDMEQITLEQAAQTVVMSSDLEITLFSCVSRHYSSQAQDATAEALRQTMKVLGAWVAAMVAQNADLIIETAASQHAEMGNAMLSARVFFARLLLSILQDGSMSEAMNTSSKESEESCKALADALQAFIALVSESDLAVARALASLQETRKVLRPLSSRTADETSAQDGNDGAVRVNGIIDAPLVNSRASSMVFLDALLDGRPSIPDALVLAYIQDRTKGDVLSGTLDLATAALDAVALDLSREDIKDQSFVPRTFLVNKIPLLVSHLSSMSFMQINVLDIIQQALANASASITPHQAQEMDVSARNSLLAEARKDFIKACAMHGLFDWSAVQHLSGIPESQLGPRESRVSKRRLIEDFKNRPSTLEAAIDKATAMDGNAVVRVEALVTTFADECRANDRTNLKTFCTALSQKRLCLDAIAVHAGLGSILDPLVQVLEGWTHGDDSDHRAAYEEYSASLVLCLSLWTRFQPPELDPARRASGHFLRRLMLDGPRKARQPATADDDGHLGAWITALFETGGVSDELLGSCAPVDFYSIVPSLFQQIAAALHAGVIDQEQLANGLELLQEPFLAPSLVLGVRQLVEQLQTSPDEAKEIVPILQKVSDANKSQGKSGGVHQTVLDLVAHVVATEIGQRLEG